ncbi:MAG: heavy metal translocating P-type ATPase [Candidatus Berkiellales bacterium]
MSGSTYYYIVTGMMCSACENSINSIVRAEHQDVIESVESDYKNGNVVVVLKNGQYIHPSKIGFSITELGYPVTSHLAKGEYYVHYFDIEGIKSPGDVTAIRMSLLSNAFINMVEINPATGRAVIIYKEKSSNEIAKLIASYGDYRAKVLTTQKTFHFAITGLTEEKDAQLTSKALALNATDVDYYKVDFSTKAVTVSVYTDNHADHIKAIKQRVKKTIGSINHPGGPNIIVDEYEDENEDENVENDEIRSDIVWGFKKAGINLAFGLGFLVLSYFFPLPITLLGKFTGVLIGGVTLAVMWHTGKEYYRNAWKKFRTDYTRDMDTMIALGTGITWAHSMLMVLAPFLFPVTSILYQFSAIYMNLFIINLGKGFTALTKERTDKQFKRHTNDFLSHQLLKVKRVNVEKLRSRPDLLALGAELYEAKNRKLVEEIIDDVGFKFIEEGDICLVGIGERCPTEGQIINNVEVFVNQEVLTGEPQDCDKKQGDNVFSGSIIKKHPVFIKATCAGSKSRVSCIHQENSNARKRHQTGRISMMMDKLSSPYVTSIFGVAAISFMWWWYQGMLGVAFDSVAAILNGICPCAWMLASIVQGGAVDLLLKYKILVRDPNALELAAHVNVVALDKTGTITSTVIDDVHHDKSLRKKEIIQYVASLEDSYLKSGGDNPFAKLFVDLNATTNLLACSQVDRSSSNGVTGVVNGKKISIGTLSHIEVAVGKENIEQSFIDQEEANSKQGKTSLYVALDNKCVAVVGLKHKLRPDAKKDIDKLIKMGITVIEVTGDKEAPAKEIAKEAGIAYIAELTPEEKKQFILSLRMQSLDKIKDAIKKENLRLLMLPEHQIPNPLPQRETTVAMVGDGLNDSPAESAAHVGIAVAPWTSAAVNAQVSLQKFNVSTLFKIGRQNRQNFLQNLFGTGVYNAFILIAGTGFFRIFNIRLTAIAGSLGMFFSSFFVLFNSNLGHFSADDELKREENGEAASTFNEKMIQFFNFKSIYKTILLLLGVYSEIDEISPRREHQENHSPFSPKPKRQRSKRAPPLNPPKPEDVVNLVEDSLDAECPLPGVMDPDMTDPDMMDKPPPKMLKKFDDIRRKSFTDPEAGAQSVSVSLGARLG